MPVRDQSSQDAKDMPKQQQQEGRSSWWSWRRSKTSRETTPAPENMTEMNKTAETKDVVREVLEEALETNGKYI